MVRAHWIWRISLFLHPGVCPMWVWEKVNPPGYGPQGLVFGSIYQGKPFWVRIFDPWPCVVLLRKGKMQIAKDFETPSRGFRFWPKRHMRAGAA